MLQQRTDHLKLKPTTTIRETRLLFNFYESPHKFFRIHQYNFAQKMGKELDNKTTVAKIEFKFGKKKKIHTYTHIQSASSERAYIADLYLELKFNSYFF